MSADRSLVGGWALGPVVGRRPAGPLREAVEPLTRRRAMFVLVDQRFRPDVTPDPDAVIRAASVDHTGIAPMLDAGLLDDGTPWYVCDPLPGPVLDPGASRSPRRALVLAEDVAQALTALHADGVVHGLVGPLTVVPGGGRHGGEPTMLLDAGVGALVGSAASALAAACGAALPADRGPAADVYALGALLLRLLTNAAVPSAALAALPLDVRALLSSLLDPDPARRPTAGATAARLARLREQVPATEAVSVVPAPVRAPAPAPVHAVGPAHSAAPARAPASGLPSAPVPAPPPARAPGLAPVPPPAVPGPTTTPAGAFPPPVPLPAPRTATSPIVVPRIAPGVARTLRTGPSAVIADPFPRPVRTGTVRTGTVRTGAVSTGTVSLTRQRRSTARRILVAGGAVALGGLLVVVVTHLPSGQEAGVHAIAAGADDAVVGIAGVGNRSTPAPTASSLVVAPAKGTSTAVPESAALQSARATPTPAFLRPVVTAAPPSAARGNAPRATTGSSSTFTSATTPPSTTPASTTPSSTTPSSATPVSSSPSSATPSATQPPASDPTATSSTAPATPTPTTTSDESATATPSASVSPTPSDSASAAQVTASTPEPTAAP